MTSGKFWEWCRTIRLGPPPSPPSSDFAFQPIDPFSVPQALWLRPTVLALPAKSTQEIRPLDRASILARPVLCHRPWGYPIRLLSKEEATALEPRLDFGPISATTLTEIEGHVDTQRVIPACVAGVVARGGVTDWNSPVTGFRLAERDGIGQVTAFSVPTEPSPATTWSSQVGQTRQPWLRWQASMCRFSHFWLHNPDRTHAAPF